MAAPKKTTELTSQTKPVLDRGEKENRTKRKGSVEGKTKAAEPLVERRKTDPRRGRADSRRCLRTRKRPTC